MSVLGKVCGHLASSSELNSGQSGARAGASRGRVRPIPPFDHKFRGYTPPLTIALKVVFFRVQSDFHPTNWVELPIHTYSLVSKSIRTRS